VFPRGMLISDYVSLVPGVLYEDDIFNQLVASRLVGTATSPAYQRGVGRSNAALTCASCNSA
jgi:hypothetical protein